MIVSAIVPPEHSGAGIPNFRYYKYLKKQGYEVALITHTAIENDNDAVIIRKSSVKGSFRKLYLIYTFFKSVFLLAYKFLFLRIKQSTIKTVLLVSCGPLTFAASIVFYLLGYKIILQNTLVGSDDPGFKYPGDFMSIKYKLKRLQYHLTDVVVTVSYSLYKLTENYHPKCVMIPNPVEPKYKAKSFDYGEKRNILFVGSLGYRKGIDIVFRTIEFVHKIEPLVKFTLVGHYDDMDDEILEIFNKAKHINKECVSFVGFQNDPAPWFEASDIFFMPSRREGFGIVFIEAMATGLPVVAKKLDDITDYIFGDNYDTILESEDPQMYAKSILELIKNKDKYDALSEKGLELVKRFSEEKIYKQYSKLIEMHK